MPDCRVTAISENSIVTKDPITTAHPSEELNVSRNDFRHNVVQKIRAICTFNVSVVVLHSWHETISLIICYILGTHCIYFTTAVVYNNIHI